MHRRPPIAAAAFVAVLALFTSAPAVAGWGAIAYDEQSGQLGSSWNQTTRERAAELALRHCGSQDCHVHAVEPKGCGALAKSDQDKAWGGADRETLEAARKEAIEHCQTHTSLGKCAVSVSGCNE